MKAFIFVLLLSVYSIASASFDCYDSFFENHQILDSKSFVIADYDLKADFDSEPVAFVKEAVANVVAKVPACEKFVQSLHVNKSDSFAVQCKELIPGKFYSRNCIAESSLGYFFVSVDMLGNVNIIFNRWD